MRESARLYLEKCLRWLDGPAQVLWPNACAVCHEPILPADDQLCPSCWQQISQAVASDYCRRCGRDISPFGIVDGKCGHCRDLELAWDGMVRVGSYADAFRNLILSLKFSERTEWADRLALMLRDAVLAAGIADEIDCVVPVPLHWRRRLGRGFNQSHLLAKKMRLHGPAVETDLVRIRYTEQQWNLTGPQRRRNVKGAFAVRRGHLFVDKTILLVDDITTSGATLQECSNVLKDAGAKEVFVAVLATAYRDPQ